MLHLIGFYTQCAPHDHGLNLTKHATRFQKRYEPFVDFVHMYNTETATLMFPGFKNYITSCPDHCSFRGWAHHFWKWKPFLIYEYMKKMDDDDLLVYHDCNIAKYKEYEIGADKFKENAQMLLDYGDIMATIDPILTNKDYVKKEVFMELGDFSEKPMIKTNRIFLRKTRFTESFILEWMTRCNSHLLLPDTNYSDFYTTHTCDQAIFNGLYYKYFDSPAVYLKDNTFTRSNIVFLNKEVKRKEIKPPVKPKRPQPSKMLVPNTAPSRQVMWMRPIGYE